MNIISRIRRAAVCSVVALGSVGCDAWSSVLEAEAEPADVITLRPVALGAVRAGSTVALVAEIPASSSEVNITFSTTAGVFVESAAKTLIVRSERLDATASKRVATAFLLAPIDTPTTHVRATVKTFYASLTLPIVP